MDRRIDSHMIALAATSLLAASCTGDRVKISGAFHGKPNKMVYVEQVAPNRKIIDSVETNSKGAFSYKYKLNSPENPEFVNLRLDNGFITLLLEKGDKPEISSIYNIPGGYNVEGSEGSKLVKELNQSIATTSNRIDSLYNLFNMSQDPQERDQLNREIAQNYINHKQNVIKFLVLNKGSLASVMAIYQKMPNGIVVFGEESDLLYYKLLADTLEQKYPNSLHVKTLLRDIEDYESRASLQNMINSSLTNNLEISVPQLTMKDMHGTEHKLSSLHGKVVLVSFWSTTTDNSALLNSELKEIYSVYKDKGFEIYQISVDQSKAQWINAVNNQSLPWISVNDFEGTSSTAVKSYNVSQIPANYLLSRDGDIIGKNLFGADLLNAISEQF